MKGDLPTMQEIHGTAMHFPWGTSDAIPAILGIPADGRPFAEYWLGAHPVAPSLVADQRLDQLVANDISILGPAATDAFGGRFPYLLKLLSARHALSIQAHPNRELAEEGFAREEAAGIRIGDAQRSYKDDWPKPELLVALSDFELLAGFRNPADTFELFDRLGVAEALESVIGPLWARRGASATEEVFLDVLSITDDRLHLVSEVLVAAVRHAGDADEVGDLARLIIELDASFPGDPGILAACLMNHVTLKPGEAVFVPPGTMHAHLSGTGVEVMANSDNVVRGGLTNKHIAVEELVSVVDFSDSLIEVLRGSEVEPGVWHYPVNCIEFAVWRIESRAGRETAVPADGAARIVLVTRGDAMLRGDGTTLPLEHGQAALLAAGDAHATLSGDAQIFVAAPGRL